MQTSRMRWEKKTRTFKARLWEKDEEMLNKEQDIASLEAECKRKSDVLSNHEVIIERQRALNLRQRPKS